MPTLSELFVGYNKAGVQYAESTGIAMRWYKVLTLVLLYLAALANAYNAFQLLTGNAYEGMASYFYQAYPAMHIVDILIGLISLAFVWLNLYARMRLAQFGREAPRLYLILLIANAVIRTISALVTFAITGYIDNATFVGSIAGGIVGYALNRIYFSKRQHLFTA